MKYIAVNFRLSETSKEAKEQVQEIIDYCEQRGLRFSSVQFLDREEEMRIEFEDKYYSDEMKQLIEECQENEWTEGEKICKNSRNILEAYSKAKKAFKERNEALEGEQIPETKSPAVIALLQAKSFKNFLARRIVRKVMEEYSQKGEKHASREKWR